jgi:cbb3-type cytochrome oxidase subunit 1
MGGALFLAGALIMVFNLWRTVYPAAEPVGRTALAPAE